MNSTICKLMLPFLLTIASSIVLWNRGLWNHSAVGAASKRKRYCFRNEFEDILLVVVFNYNLYSQIPALKKLYKRAFPNMIFCGPDISSSGEVLASEIHKGYFGYMCASDAMTSRNHAGYLVAMDDVLVNFWQFRDLDKRKLWEGPKLPISVANYTAPKVWYWWGSRWGQANCQRAVDEIAFLQNSSDAYERDFGKHYMSHLTRNGEGKIKCFGGRSDIFYVPRHFANDFILLTQIFRKHRVFIEIAVPTIFRMLDLTDQMALLNGVYLPGRAGDAPVKDSRYLWRIYSSGLHFIHPVKMNYSGNSLLNKAILTHVFEPFALAITAC